VVLVTDSAHISGAPEEVQTLVSAHIETLAWMDDNPADWILDMVGAFGGDVLLSRQVAEGLDYTAELSNSMTAELGALATELAAAGVIPAAPPASLAVDDAFVTEDDAS